MEHFAIDTVRELVAQDLQKALGDSQTALQILLSGEGNEEQIAQASAAAHNMRGVCGLIGAHGLSCWGRTLEQLYAGARHTYATAPEQSQTILRFVAEHLMDWYEMCQFTLDNQFDAALERFYTLHAAADVAFPQLLSAAPSKEELDTARSAPAKKVATEVVPVPVAEAVPAVLSVPVIPEIETAVELVAEPVPQAAVVEDDFDFVAIFREEVIPYFGEISQALHQLEKEPERADAWYQLRRLFHTFKGSAASVGLDDVAAIARVAEERMSVVEESPALQAAEGFQVALNTAAELAEKLGSEFNRAEFTVPGADVAKVPEVEVPEVEVPEESATSEPEVEAAKVEAEQTAPESSEIETFSVADKTAASRKTRGPRRKRAKDKKAEGEATERQAEEQLQTVPEIVSEVVPLEEISAPEVDPGLAKILESLAVKENLGSADDAVDNELLEAFEADGTEQLAALEKATLLWEKGDNPREQVNVSRRAFHTLKGAANSIGLKRLGASLHRVEDYLDYLGQKTEVTVPPQLFGFLFQCVDDIRAYLDGLRKDGGHPWTYQWNKELHSVLGQREVKDDSLAAKSAALSSALHQSRTQSVSGKLAGVSPTSQQLPYTTEPAAGAEQKVSAKVSAVEKGAKAEPLDLAQFAVKAPAQEPAESKGSEERQTIRVEADRLLQLMNLMGELVIDRNRLDKRLSELRQSQRGLNTDLGRVLNTVEQFQQQFEFSLMENRAAEGSARTGAVPRKGAEKTLPQAGKEQKGDAHHKEFSELEFDRYDQFNILARALTEVAHDMQENVRSLESVLANFLDDSTRFANNSRQIQESISSLTLLPVGTLVPRLQRAFRDAVKEEGKEAELVIEGESTLLDKTIIDRVYTPLLHLVRNAASHGIESADVRQAAGKPRRGTVRFGARQSASQVFIYVQDDGAGINAAAVRKRAIERGLLSATAPELDRHEVIELLFKPGFSTAEKITSVSGRGVGMDIVRKEIESLNGTMECTYEEGKGSSWVLKLPLTLTVTEAILVVCGGQTLAVPLSFISSGLILDPELIHVDEHGLRSYTLEYEDGNVEAPVFSMSRMLGLTPGEEQSALLIAASDTQALITVDQLLHRQEIVIRQLDTILAGHPFLNGATIDADGKIILILNAAALLKAEGRAPVLPHLLHGAELMPESRPEVERPRILIVDDSLSVRKVQQKMLEGLNCDATVAADGLEALEKLRAERFDLVLTDLEMPRMSGYELITEMRSNAAYSHLPIIVISSRGADKYITKAMSLGATSFLAKPFTETQFATLLSHYLNWKGHSPAVA